MISTCSATRFPESWGKCEWPTHIPTEQNRNKIRLLLAFGWTNNYIVRAIRITGGPLKKHYFRELRQREEVRPALKAARCGDA